jgi:uncharacterized protein with NRDE domain
MCLVLLAHRTDPAYRLVVAANRDEFFGRPTAPADYWAGAPDVLGGRDLEKGGTWMGIARDGRWAAITNFRDGMQPAPGARSRGELVANFLLESTLPLSYVSSVERIAQSYSGFNLLVGDQRHLHYFSNRRDGPLVLTPGIYGLSNGLLHAPWPKVERGKVALRRALARATGPDHLIELLLADLADRSAAEDHALPQTGIDKDWEKRLSATFISAPGYGTRASTVILIAQDGEVHFRERSFDVHGELIDDRRFQFVPSEAPVKSTD